MVCARRESDSIEPVTNSLKQPKNEIDGIVPAFASMVRSGLILLIGNRAYRCRNAVISAMEPLTRLIVNLHPDSGESESEDASAHDLRVAVHRQNPEDFLKDVSHHSLNLVVTGNEFSELLAQRITSMLLDGACWLILDVSDCAEIPKQVNADAFHSVSLGSGLLLVKKNKVQSAVRKGGRRTRLAGGGL